jgi:small-conductance mechanosensitive channel
MTTILTFLTAHLNDFIAIAVTYLIGQLALFLLARRLCRTTNADGSVSNRRKRTRTIGQLVHGVGHAALLLILAFWILRIFNVDPTPVLASAGVVGLAIGFGAQTLVKDFISGLFIIAENQYGIGDQVKINGFEGEVKHLSVRSTVLEDKDGHSIFIPNGSISVVINVSDSAKK